MLLETFSTRGTHVVVTYTLGWKKFIISKELIITVLKRTSEIISFTGEPVTQYHKLGALNLWQGGRQEPTN